MLRFHLTSVRTATIKNTTNVGENVREKRTLIHCLWKCKLVQPLWKMVWRILKKLKTELPYDPAIPLLGIHWKECNNNNKDTCTPMYIAALFTIAKPWKQPRCSITDEWIKNMWCLHTMEFYFTIRKSEILLFAGNGWNWRTSS
jgi:hypothetical protein